MKKIKINYNEKYKNQSMMINKNALPKLKHINDNFTVSDCEIKEAGCCSVDGEEMEFQVLKVYLKEVVR